MPINNTFYGKKSLEKNKGDNNTAIGAYSLTNNLDPSCNTSVGSNSLFSNTTGRHNTALGAGAMCNNVIGSINTAVGSSALEGTKSGTTTGNQNVALGAQSLYTNYGSQNTSVGTYSLLKNVDGSNNVALGFFAGENNINGSNNTFLGSKSGQEIGDTNIYAYATAIGAGSIIDSSNQIIMGRPSGEDTVEVPGTLNAKQMFLTNNFFPSEKNAVMPKEYIDTIANGLNPIGSSSCIANDTLDPINLLSFPPLEIDGYKLQNGDKVVINDQPNLINNGIWIANTIDGNWSRPSTGENMSIGYDALGALTFVTNGNKYGKTGWCQIINPCIIGTDNVSFNIFYQFNYNIGEGLEIVTIGSDEVLQVKENLNFLENITVGQTITANNIVQSGTISQSGSGTNVLKNTDISGNLNVSNSTTSAINCSSNANIYSPQTNIMLSDGLDGFYFFPSFTTGWTNFPTIGDRVILARGTDIDVASLSLTTWSTGPSAGIRISPNAIKINATTFTVNGTITQSSNSDLIQSGTGIISQSGTGTNRLKETNISGNLVLTGDTGTNRQITSSYLNLTNINDGASGLQAYQNVGTSIFDNNATGPGSFLFAVNDSLGNQTTPLEFRKTDTTIRSDTINLNTTGSIGEVACRGFIRYYDNITPFTKSTTAYKSGNTLFLQGAEADSGISIINSDSSNVLSTTFSNTTSSTTINSTSSTTINSTNIDLSGNVGIGISTPSRRLVVVNNGTQASFTQTRNDETDGTIISANGSIVEIKMNNGGLAYFSIQNDGAFKIINSSSSASPFTTGTTLMSINTSGDTTIAGRVSIEGNITNHATQPSATDSSKHVPTTAWVQSALSLSGSTIFTQVYYFGSPTTNFTNNITMTATNSTLSANSNWQEAFRTTNNFTPRNVPYATYLFIEITALYRVTGSGRDRMFSRMNLFFNSTNNYIGYNYQNWQNASGGGGRSGTLFPISAPFNLSANWNNSIRISSEILNSSTFSDDSIAFIDDGGSSYQNITIKVTQIVS